MDIKIRGMTGKVYGIKLIITNTGKFETFVPINQKLAGCRNAKRFNNDL